VGRPAQKAHVSIARGTELAPEDPAALGRALDEQRALDGALPADGGARKPIVDAFQAAALRSLTWLENVEAHLDLDPIPFTYKHMMRSQRIGHARLEQMDPAFVALYDAWRAGHPSSGPVPREFLDLFEKATFAHLSTLMPDGSP